MELSNKAPMQLHEERLERLRTRAAKADKTTIVAFPTDCNRRWRLRSTKWRCLTCTAKCF